jgi:AraC family L-rhamnose operon transcriptional activator RhaR
VIFLSETPIIIDNGDEKFGKGEMIYLNRTVVTPYNNVHQHNYIEIAYVTSGKGIHLIGDRKFEVSKGDLFIINYDVPHEFRSVPPFNEVDFVIYNCIFKPEYIDKSLISSRCFSDISHIFLFNSLFVEETSDNDIKLLGKNHIDIEDLYEKMYLEFHTKSYGYQEILRAYLVVMLMKIFRLYRQNETIETRAQKKYYFDNVIEFMKKHYRHEIKLEELAAMTFLSRNYFCTCFKENTGLTVLEYIQNLRIEEACSLLMEKDRKIIDIAESVGYRDLKFFNRLFKKITGKTPSGYRKFSSIL